MFAKNIFFALKKPLHQGRGVRFRETLSGGLLSSNLAKISSLITLDDRAANFAVLIPRELLLQLWGEVWASCDRAENKPALVPRELLLQLWGESGILFDPVNRIEQ
jgi:hypothetical protein